MRNFHADDYVANKGQTCPHCGEAAVSWQDGAKLDFDEAQVVIAARCDACQSSWEDVYGLAAFRNLTTPDTSVSGDELEIMKMWVISTAHLPQQERVLLNSWLRGTDTTDDSVHPAVVDPVGEYGWRVDVSSIEAEAISVAPVLTRLALMAQANGCEMLQLDRDGPVHTGLELFED